MSQPQAAAPALPVEFDAAAFTYDLPAELIAQYPEPERTASRMLVLSRTGAEHSDRHVRDLPELLTPNDLLVFNDTRVIPARLYAHRKSGGRVEMLIERVRSATEATAQLRVNRTPAIGERLSLNATTEVELTGREGRFWQVVFPDGVAQTLEQFGHVPLPPYIDRADETTDRERYQTVYAAKPGAVAAPTAGLHFDAALLENIAQLGVAQAFVTLHVAAGTFRPLDGPDIREHTMHAEQLTVDRSVCDAVAACRDRGGRVIAVGTTAVRALETAAAAGTLAPFSGDTQLYLYPGSPFRVVDGLLTNFHLPQSSLLLLVCAFAGTERVLAAYRHAVAERYRFFSYGDAMLIV